MHQVVIVGGGPGGTITANHLAEEFTSQIRRGDVSVTLVTDQAEQVYKPGFLYLAFGLETPGRIKRSVRELVNPLVEVRLARASRVDAGKRELLTDAGERLSFDQLVLATGSRVDMGATPGLAEAGDSFYDEAGALRLNAKLRDLREGRVVISVIGVPHMCPVAPLEMAFMLDDWLRRRGVRDDIDITYTYPINRIHSIPEVAEWAKPELERRGVKLETFFNAEAVDPERKVLTSMEGTELPFDVLIAIPEHRSAPFLEASGLTQFGWVPTMRDTLAVKGFEGIWALGDTTDLPVSKAGSVAHYQAGVIARNVAARVRGQEPVASYEGKTICFIEAGLERATFLEFDYHRPPKLEPPTKLIHWAKLAYNNAYWLTAKGIV